MKSASTYTWKDLGISAANLASAGIMTLAANSLLPVELTEVDRDLNPGQEGVASLHRFMDFLTLSALSTARFQKCLGNEDSLTEIANRQHLLLLGPNYLVKAEKLLIKGIIKHQNPIIKCILQCFCPGNIKKDTSTKSLEAVVVTDSENQDQDKK